MNPNDPYTPPQPPTPPPYGEKPVTVQSHVTVQPDSIQGQNFDPQLRAQYANEPDVVHATRPVDPPALQISDEVRQKHDQSVRDYPFLNLSEGEFVIMNIQRHPIGLFIPVATSVAVIILLLSVLFSYPMIQASAVGADGAVLPGFDVIALLIIPLCLVIGLFGYIAVWVYLRNQFYLTNESVIQEIQHSLFSKNEQTASLGSIEDVSFVQNGIVQTMFNYGSIRLSTEGDETTYRFHYVAEPKEQTGVLTNAVEAFKNGRPVGD